jgi:hypothetical protein
VKHECIVREEGIRDRSVEEDICQFPDHFREAAMSRMVLLDLCIIALDSDH